MARPALEDEFGDVIKKARFGLDLSAAAVAGAVGITERELASFEAYDGKPERPVVALLAAQLKLGEAALWASAQSAWGPSPPPTGWPDGLWLESFTIPPVGSHAYLIGKGGEAILIDAGGAVEEIQATLAKRRARLVSVLLTHAHGDHVEGLAHVVQRTGAAVYAELREWTAAVTAACRPQALAAGQSTALGGLSVRVLASGGHTAGGLAFVVAERACFTGDTLFAGSLGRARTPAAYPELLASARLIIAEAPELGLFPGHGPATSVAQECGHNPFLT